MKPITLLAALLLPLTMVNGCKDDSSGGPTTPPAPTGVVRAVCESVGLRVEAGTFVGGEECLQDFTFHDDESCQFTPVSQSFSGSCRGLEPDCGADFSTSASGSIEFFPEFDSATGGLSAVRVSGSVSSEFSGTLGGSCGQIGSGANAAGNASIRIEVLDDPVTAKLTGTLNFGSTGASTPTFKLFSSDGFEFLNPTEGQSISESFELQPGTYKFTVSIRARPQLGAGPSTGDFNLSLRFE